MPPRDGDRHAVDHSRDGKTIRTRDGPVSSGGDCGEGEDQRTRDGPARSSSNGSGGVMLRDGAAASLRDGDRSGQETREELHAEKVQWRTELYAVRGTLVAEFSDALNFWPEVDMFSVKASARFARFWGPDSEECTDAFKKFWGNGTRLWANPPFSMFHRVVSKIREERAMVLVCMPLWDDRSWYKKAKEITIRSVKFEKGCRIFELDGVAVPPVR